LKAQRIVENKNRDFSAHHDADHLLALHAAQLCARPEDSVESGDKPVFYPVHEHFRIYIVMV
jgi:hypothetical protein